MRFVRSPGGFRLSGMERICRESWFDAIAAVAFRACGHPDEVSRTSVQRDRSEYESRSEVVDLKLQAEAIDLGLSSLMLSCRSLSLGLRRSCLSCRPPANRPVREGAVGPELDWPMQGLRSPSELRRRVPSSWDRSDGSPCRRVLGLPPLLATQRGGRGVRRRCMRQSAESPPFAGMSSRGSSNYQPSRRERPGSELRSGFSSGSSTRIALLCVVFTLVSLTLVSTEVSQAVEGTGLEKRWVGLLHSQGVLVEEAGGYLFRTDGRSEGSYKVREVTADYVAFTVQRDQNTWERVVPISRLAFEVAK